VLLESGFCFVVVMGIYWEAISWDIRMIWMAISGMKKSLPVASGRHIAAGDLRLS
jgi:hypothetical protein